jgi:type II secretory pathway pseudopilin PulG
VGPLMTLPSHSKKSGFGLIGMLLLLLLSSIGAYIIFSTMVPSASTKAMSITTTRVAALRVAILAYQKSHGGAAGTYPPTLSSLVTTDGTACTAINDPTQTATYLTLQGWCGPYIDSIYAQASSDFQKDGWEQLFLYSSTTNIITSCGPDHICGDGDDIAFSP